MLQELLFLKPGVWILEPRQSSWFRLRRDRGESPGVEGPLDSAPAMKLWALLSVPLLVPLLPKSVSATNEPSATMRMSIGTVAPRVLQMGREWSSMG
jgi:hypothetical protein